jgi:nicotinate-nucleotide adenylyltransferase
MPVAPPEEASASSSQTDRVALFGGTFDPPHRGHIAVARAAADTFRLGKVLFAPVARQPLKAGATATSFEDRLAMVRLACAGDPRFEASAVDAPRPDGVPNYTIDTIETLLRQMPAVTLFNLVGADSFASLPHWHQHDRLLTLAQWIVVSRPGYPLTDPAIRHLAAQSPGRIHLIDTVHEEVAATELRCRLEQHLPLGDLVDPAIASYIHRHNLYTTRSS